MELPPAFMARLATLSQPQQHAIRRVLVEQEALAVDDVVATVLADPEAEAADAAVVLERLLDLVAAGEVAVEDDVARLVARDAFVRFAVALDRYRALTGPFGRPGLEPDADPSLPDADPRRRIAAAMDRGDLVQRDGAVEWVAPDELMAVIGALQDYFAAVADRGRSPGL